MPTLRTCTILAAMLLVVGCSAAASGTGEVPSVETGSLTPNETNDGAWSLTARQPEQPLTWATSDLDKVVFGVEIDGPSGQTRKMGACLLEYTTTTCTATSQQDVDTQCASAPSTVPSGGYRYCVNHPHYYGGAKYCAFRPGPTSTHCVGTPQNGGNEIGPGTYWSGQLSFTSGRVHATYGCFAGCQTLFGDVSPGLQEYIEVPIPGGYPPGYFSYCFSYADGVQCMRPDGFIQGVGGG
jgi:hypothetical protein